MLNVIVNRCKDIGSRFNGSLIYNDSHLFSIFNGESEFLGKSYTVEQLNEFIDDLVAFANETSDLVILHTFNALVLNFFKDEDAIETFYYFKESENNLKLFFKEERMLEKLTALCPGEVVCDTILEN